MSVTGIVIQTRLGSTRLPGKVLASIEGKPALWHVWQRACQIKRVDKVILAIPDSEEDSPLLWWARALGIACFSGSAEDVLDRYYQAAKLYRLDNIIRITGDCPCLDPTVSDLVVDTYLKLDYDYVTNREPRNWWPDGLDTEIFNFATLEKAWYTAKEQSDREHVTSWMYREGSGVRTCNIKNTIDLSGLRWTLDTPTDLAYIQFLYKRLGYGFKMKDVLIHSVACNCLV